MDQATGDGAGRVRCYRACEPEGSDDQEDDRSVPGRVRDEVHAAPAPAAWFMEPHAPDLTRRMLNELSVSPMPATHQQKQCREIVSCCLQFVAGSFCLLSQKKARINIVILFFAKKGFVCD